MYCQVIYYTVQYCNVLWYNALNCTVQYCNVLWYNALNCTVQYKSIQYSTVQYSTVQYSRGKKWQAGPGINQHSYTVEIQIGCLASWVITGLLYSSYCTVLYCTVLYCTVLYCTVLYCTVLYCGYEHSRNATSHLIQGFYMAVVVVMVVGGGMTCLCVEWNIIFLQFILHGPYQ